MSENHQPADRRQRSAQKPPARPRERKPRPRKPRARSTPSPEPNGHQEQPAAAILSPPATTQGGLSAIPVGNLGHQAISWLVPDLLATGAITLLEGDPGTGKSVLAADLAAAVSTCREWAGRAVEAAGTVLILAVEDDPRTTIRPRLISAGADLARVSVVTWGTGERRQERPTLPGCAADLVELLHQISARLLILDTLASLVGPGVSLNDTSGATDYMSALQWIASVGNVSVLGIRHHNKATSQRALMRGSGSIAITGAARVVLALARTTGKGSGVLAGVKTNLGPLPEPQGYRLDSVGDSVKVLWTGVPGEDLDELMAAGAADPGDRCKRDLAEEVICTLVGDGWVSATTIFEAARDHGIGERTVWSARARLKCQSRPATGGAKQRWEWGPPVEGWPK